MTVASLLDRGRVWQRRGIALVRRWRGLPPLDPDAARARRERTPTIIQMEAVECGAAALAMVLAYWKRWVPLEDLRYACGVSRDGSKASNILRAARNYGLDAKGWKYDDLDKLRDLPFPAILFWNFNHFVVLEGFDDEGRAFLNDPAQGPRLVSRAELDDAYSGIVLTFEPTAEFRPGGAPPDIIAALRRRLDGNHEALRYVLLCGLCLVVPGLVVPTFTRVFVDDYLLGGQAWLIRPLIVAMLITAVVQGALTWLQQYFLLRLETKIALTTSSRFFNHILRLPAAYFGQRFAGEIGSRVQINDRVAKVMSGKLATTLIDFGMTGFYALLMLLYDVPMTLTVIAIASLNVAVVVLASRRRTDISSRLVQDKGKLMGTAMGGLQMIETLKATGSEDEFFARYAGYHARAMNTEQELNVLSQWASAVPPLTQTLATAAVFLIGGLDVMAGNLTVGMLVAYQTLLVSFMRPLTGFVQFGSMLQELQADMNRLDDVLRYPQSAEYATPDDAAIDPATVKLSGRVELRNVTFGYSPLEPPLIRDFNLSVEPGRRVALVGGSGSGKSTVAKLIAGLYAPWEGDVLFDGVPRRQVPRHVLANSIGCVDQDIFMFSGTVRDNVIMWDETMNPQRVSRACRDAALSRVIDEREGGYQAQVHEGGGNFSGGQCQRLEIARALVGEPSVLVLDEATSALDPPTELLIDEGIRRRGCTCVIIAHRLSTIRDCDEILVMQRGTVVQRGTHDQLKNSDGPYRALIAH